MEFTTNQLEAINEIKNNTQIIACAGSGKTTTIVGKIINIIKETECNPENLVCITYTEKAAASLKQKIYKEYQNKFNNIQGLSDMYIGTIHGFCLNLLHEFAFEFKNFDTLNEIQSKLFIKKNISQSGFNNIKNQSNNKYLKDYSMSIFKRINIYKIFLDTVREYGIEKFDNPEIKIAVDKYEKLLQAHCFFDFTSILMTTLSFLNSGKIDEYISNKIKYLIIDEYQDINDTQEQIINYFHSKGSIINVVGDDDQTIYHWRGSNLTYIKDFKTRYENVATVNLDTNFRSSKGIIEIASQVINNNNNRLLKDIKSNNSQPYEDSDILALEFENRDDEINFIINKIKQLQQTKYTKNGNTFGLSLDDMVIIVSSVRKIPELIKKLNDEKIDFLVEGTKELFETKEIQLLIKTFSCLTQINENTNIDDFINTSYIQNLILKWQELLEISYAMSKNAIFNFINHYMTKDAYEYTIQENFSELLTNFKIYDLGINYEKKLYNFGEFTIIINDFETINILQTKSYRINNFINFLTYDAENIYPEGWLSPNFKAVRCLRIMTYHQTKGLEFPVVFLPFLTKYAFFPLRAPGGLSHWHLINKPEIKTRYSNNEESIRRLFYVGLTRSEKYLFMTRSPYNKKNNPAQPFIEAKNSIYVQYKPFLEKKYQHCATPRFSNDEVLSLNFSLLKDFFECPFKFKLLNIFNFIQPLNIRMGYGKSIHNMLEYIHKNHETLDFSNIDTLSSSLVDKFLYLPYGSKKLYEAMTNKAKTSLTSYILNNQKNFAHIKFAEKKIDYTVNEYLFINGRIDLIKDDISQKTTIVDFKSSSDVLTKEQIRNQLMIYVLGYEDLTAEKVDYIESYDFNHTNPTVIPITEEEKNIFKEKLKDTKEAISKGNFKKVILIDEKKDKDYCKSIGCVFYNYCHKK